MADQAKIMVVDDEHGVMSCFVQFLSAVGYEAVGYTDANVALKELKTTSPNLILLDIMMPQMDGYEFCRRMKQDPEFSEIPVVFVSGKDREDDAMKSTSEGGDLFISKPVPFDVLKEVVDLALNDMI